MFATGYKDYFKTSKFSHENTKNLNGMKFLTSRMKSDDNRLNEIFNHIGLNEQKIKEKSLAIKSKKTFKRPYRIKPVEKNVKNDYHKNIVNKNINENNFKNNNKKQDHEVKVNSFYNVPNKNVHRVFNNYQKNELNEDKSFEPIPSHPDNAEKMPNVKIEKSEKYTNTLPVLIFDNNSKNSTYSTSPNSNLNNTPANFNNKYNNSNKNTNSFMSLRKKKQLEWEKEKVDAEKYFMYNPWGKPGGGTNKAPLKPPTFQTPVTVKEASPTRTPANTAVSNDPTTPTTPTRVPGFTKIGHHYMDVDENKEKIKKMQYLSYQKELGEQIKEKQERKRMELEKLRKLEEEEEKNFKKKNIHQANKLTKSSENNSDANSHYERYNNRVIGINNNPKMDYLSNLEAYSLCSSPAMSKLMPSSKERITNKNTVLYSTEKEREENKRKSYALYQSMLLEQIEAKKLEKELQRQNRLKDDHNSSYNLMTSKTKISMN